MANTPVREDTTTCHEDQSFLVYGEASVALASAGLINVAASSAVAPSALSSYSAALEGKPA